MIDHLTVGNVQSKRVRIATPLGVAGGSSIAFTGFTAAGSGEPAVDAVLEVDVSAAKSVATAFTFAGASIPAAAKHVNIHNVAAEGMLSTRSSSTSGFRVGAIMIDSGGAGQYAGPSISNVAISHSESDGIASFAGTSGGYCSTDYDKSSITFSDIAGDGLATGPCNWTLRGLRRGRTFPLLSGAGLVGERRRLEDTRRRQHLFATVASHESSRMAARCLSKFTELRLRTAKR